MEDNISDKVRGLEDALRLFENARNDRLVELGRLTLAKEILTESGHDELACVVVEEIKKVQKQDKIFKNTK